MALDERLRRELDQAAQPADPSGLYEHLIRRRERRRIARRVQSGFLAVIVLLGSAGGFYALTRIFRETEKPPPVASPAVSNGVIVFSLPLEDGGKHLFTVGPDGSGLRQITPEGRAVYRSPDVSPDGRTVLVLHQIPSFEPWQSVLAVVPIEGGSPTWVTEKPWLVLDPTWSPDGEHIAFAGSPGGPYGIYVLDVASGDVRLIPETDAMSVGHPTWSPDGSRIAFGASVNTPDIPDERWDIFSVHPDGTQLVNLTNTPDHNETWPAWSWSIDRIAFVRGGERPGVYTMAPDGSGQTLVIDELPDPASPTWSPDGTMLAFSADTGQIYIVGVDGTDLRAVTGALGEPAWQAIPNDSIPAPTPTPTPTEEPQPEGEDIGVGFRVCFAERLGRIDYLGDGTDGNAWTAVPVKDDGSCPRYPAPDEYLLAVDHTGDRVADSWIDLPFECATWCPPFDATDLDGNGTEELIVVNSFSIMGYSFFEVRPHADGDLRVEPILVAVPGHEPAGISTGEPLQIDAGGDAGYSSSIECEGYPSEPVIVWSWSFGPIETDEPTEVHVTRIELQPDGLFHVIDTNDFTVPAREPTGVANAYEIGPQCGVDWYR